MPLPPLAAGVRMGMRFTPTRGNFSLLTFNSSLLTNQGIAYPFAAAGGLANKTPLLRNVALFSPAFAFRPQAVAAFADEKKAMLFCIAFLFAESEGFEPPDP